MHAFQFCINKVLSHRRLSSFEFSQRINSPIIQLYHVFTRSSVIFSIVYGPLIISILYAPLIISMLYGPFA